MQEGDEIGDVGKGASFTGQRFFKRAGATQALAADRRAINVKGRIGISFLA